jgi:hypothetical protein
MGHGHLMVAPTSPPPAGLEALVSRLLEELNSAADVMGGNLADQCRVLRAGLSLVAGQILEADVEGTTDEVLKLAAISIAARAPALSLEVEQPPNPAPVAAPAMIALALVQLAVNAHVHESALRARLWVESGPNFHLTWPSDRATQVKIGSHRHRRDRIGWGWGYVRMVADLLGAVALPPAPLDDEMDAGLSMGSRRLAIPLAVYGPAGPIRSTPTWAQEVTSSDPDRRNIVNAHLAAVIDRAQAAPGRIVYEDLYSARTSGAETWVALPPQTGTNRILDVLHGLEHEKALWGAPEPHATKVCALIRLMQTGLGQPWEGYDPTAWARMFPTACSALGLPTPLVTGAFVWPDPRVAAYLLRAVGGELVASVDGVTFKPSHSDPILTALERGRDGRYALTPAITTGF